MPLPTAASDFGRAVRKVSASRVAQFAMRATADAALAVPGMLFMTLPKTTRS